ncbi:MAG: S9 family peptidase [Ginsengibacter sp.]
MKGILIFFFTFITINIFGQGTLKDYQRAESYLPESIQKLIDNSAPIQPNWLDGDKFWYSKSNSGSAILVDPVSKISKEIDASTYGTKGGTERGRGRRQQGRQTLEVISPNGKLAAFIKNNNLWMRSTSTNVETQLTKDGVKDFGYATDNAGWAQSDAPVIKWSPDSKKIATFKQDQRNVGDMYLVTTNVGHPVLKSWKYPLPGDKNIIMIQRVIINVDAPKVIFLKTEADPHRASLSDDIKGNGELADAQWSEDSKELAFVSSSRDHKIAKVRIANASTGDVRDVFKESSNTQFESGQRDISWRYLAKTHEIIWYSERDNYGHLYLYDAKTGAVKNQITTGNTIVAQLSKVDENSRMIYFEGVGGETENPYFTQLFKVGFDGKGLQVLTPEAGNHVISLSPSNNFFVDTYSKPDMPPVSVLKNINGTVVMDLQKVDVTRLTAFGWKAPMPVTVKAHDGNTDLYGLLFIPSNLDPNKKYPIIDYIYPGPQGGGIGDWSFHATRRDNQALAELGFIVVVIEGSSNPLRSKSYHDMYYPNMSENTLPDQVTAIRQLATRFHYIDTSRVGIWGHSGGGYATAAAMFRFPDFFKVGISESGNHENRNYEDDWGERYVGLLTKNADGTDNYTAQANQLYAKNLKGKLMLAHGMMDDNVPPSNTMLVIDALEKANKDYDLVIFPNSAHGYGRYSTYMMRRRWDYFVKNLLGVEPPKEYKFQSQPGME